MARWIVLFLLLVVAAVLSGLTVAGGASFALVKGMAFVLVITVAGLALVGIAVVRRIARMTR